MKCHKICDMENFDAIGYAKWFNENFEKSGFKSLRQVAKAVNISPESISQLARANEESEIKQLSRPKLKLVDDISDLFQRPRNEARRLCGWADDTREESMDLSFLEGYFTLPEERRAQARKLIKAIIRSLQEA